MGWGARRLSRDYCGGMKGKAVSLLMSGGESVSTVLRILSYAFCSFGHCNVQYGMDS